jgi:hypothetical protein
LAELSETKVFTKLDANSGFWQIPLAEESKLLIAFLTPIGRYCFNKLPCGMSAPEIFQRMMNNMLFGLDGFLCLIDDTLVYGRSQEEHDRRLEKVLERMQSKGITLNPQKCEFSKDLTWLCSR